MKIKISKRDIISTNPVTDSELIKCGEDFINAVKDKVNTPYNETPAQRYIVVDKVISTGCVLFTKVCYFAFVFGRKKFLKSQFDTPEDSKF